MWQKALCEDTEEGGFVFCSLLEKAGLDETIVKYSLLNLSGLSCDASAEMNNRLSEGI